MRALVTGSAGFVGRHMVAALLRSGWSVDECDIDDHAGGIDCLDVFRVETGRFDLVVHCAAKAPHRAAIDHRPALMAYNLMLDAAMFDWAVRTGQRRVLYFSSSAAYPIDLQNDYATARALCEADIRGGAHNIGRPDAGYGWVKLTGEEMAAAAAKAGLAVHVVRPFSGYGETQSLDFPFGAFVDRARRREDPFVIWGSGEQVRDWVHIDDVVAGALAVVEADVREPVNLCTGVGTSMARLAHMLAEAAGYEPQFDFVRDAPEGVAYRVGSPTGLHKFYVPKVSIEDGVRRVGLP